MFCRKPRLTETKVSSVVAQLLEIKMNYSFFSTMTDIKIKLHLCLWSLFNIIIALCAYTTSYKVDTIQGDLGHQPWNHFSGQLFEDVLTWRHPVSAARGFSAEPPNWPSRPQTLFSSPPALCTVPPSSFSSARGVAPAEG